MIFRQIGFSIFVRVLLLFCTLNLAVYTVEHLFYPQVISIFLVIAGQVWELVGFLTRGNNELARFILAIKNRDFTQRFPENKSRADLRQLHQAFNQINDTFTKLQLEKEAQYQFLQTILQLIDTGIISYDSNGEVIWINEAFRRTLHVPHLKHITALEKRQETLYQTIKNLKPNDSELLKLKVNQNPLQLLISSTAFRMQQRDLTLLAFKNVSNTVDQTETEAWQKLLRVMTHEIMNSVAPIASLADTMLHHLRRNKEQLAAENQPQPNAEILTDTEEVISVIQNRSEGLLKFAQIYRNLSKVTDLTLTTVYIEELFQAVCALLKPRLEQEGIALKICIGEPDLTLKADPHLLEQVLINLILNAERAVKNRPNPTISLACSLQENGQPIIEVEDNGTGIPEELLDSIFIPFFTSHKDGSGIGLSLAKQIITLHKGSIQVKTREGEGTVFSLVF